MKKTELLLILISTTLTTSALYAPQPLSPVFMKYFQISKTQSAFIMSAGIIPLSVAPIFYGYLLEKISPTKILSFAIFFLSLSVFLFSISKSYNSLILFRFIQGIFIPASLVSTMTYLSITADSTNIQKRLATYIAFSILGGFSGRLISGLISSILGWRYVFSFLSLSLFLCFIFLIKIPPLSHFKESKNIELRIILNILKNKKFFNIYPLPFIIFFVFLSVLNYIPFRLIEIKKEINEFIIGIIYAGYLLGIVISLKSLTIVDFFKSEKKAIIAGISFYIFFMTFLFFKEFYIIFPAIFLICGCLFWVHSISSGYVNKIAIENKGMINALYVSFYYAGGAIGSYLPGFIYVKYGWNFFLIFNLSLLFLVLLIAMSIKQIK